MRARNIYNEPRTLENNEPKDRGQTCHTDSGNSLDITFSEKYRTTPEKILNKVISVA